MGDLVCISSLLTDRIHGCLTLSTGSFFFTFNRLLYSLNLWELEAHFRLASLRVKNWWDTVKR